MRWIENKIDRFCRDHPNFGIPNLMLYIAVGQVAVYLIDTFSMSGSALSNLLYFSRYAIFRGEIWRLATFVFIPTGGDLFFRGTGIFFVILSAYFYFWVGGLMEREMGTAKFTLFYLSGIFLNIIYGLVTGHTNMYYIHLSFFFSIAVLFPDTWIRIFFILPVKLKWIAWIDAALFAFDVIVSLIMLDFIGALLPIVAIFNFIVFFWSFFVEWATYRKQSFQHQHSQQTINFKKATKSAYQEKGYLHKCAVCGKTDTDFPDMEFRYCSKCNGYYCYCAEHINNHQHIQ